MSFFKSLIAAGLLASADLVAGHGAIINAVGDAGGQGSALGVDSSTPRDGTRRNPFQTDSTRFRGQSASTFGETLAGGSNNLESGTKAIMAESGEQLPQISQGGSVDMTLHQVNADGGGPYTCEINSDASGANWKSITVTTTPPGRNSNNRSGAQTDFPLIASIPNNQECTGTVAGQDNVCLVRCMNAARAGPFGGVVPVQMTGTATKEQARRALINSIKRDLEDFERLKKRFSTFEDPENPEDDPEYLAELRADGEEI